jgi:hypothetical protein
MWSYGWGLFFKNFIYCQKKIPSLLTGFYLLFNICLVYLSIFAHKIPFYFIKVKIKVKRICKMDIFHFTGFSYEFLLQM